MLKKPGLANLIAIIGNTGVGKSQLSIEIAKAINGEIINGDSMQVYKGLDNMTNKHPLSERENIPHHLLGHVPWDEEYGVKQFEEEATRLVDDIVSRGKVPILVGGTHYYIQSMLFKNSTVSGIIPVNTETQLTKEQSKILDSDPETLFSHLQKNDPLVAAKFHPNDTRRVRRALEIFYTTNKKASQIYSEQQGKGGLEEDFLSHLRYRSLVLWVWCERDTLNRRLDARVDQMINSGLFSELQDMFSEYKRLGDNVDLERGIWQVIGFKQFLPWLKGEASIDNSTERMKLATRQYAHRQTKWINKKLLSMLDDTKQRTPDRIGDVALLDSTNLSNWHQNVSARGVQFAREFLEGKAIPLKYGNTLAPSGMEAEIKPRSSEDSFSADKWKHFTCDTCLDSKQKKVICIGEHAWKIHSSSRRHKRAQERKKNDTQLVKEHRKRKLTESTETDIQPEEKANRNDTGLS